MVSNIQGTGARYVLQDNATNQYFNLKAGQTFLPKQMTEITATGFRRVGDKVQYLSTSGYLAKNTFIQIGANQWYYFDKNGYRITDLTSRYSGPYTVQVDRVNGVMTVFADSARTIPVKTIRVSVGLASTPTPTGPYTLSRSARWQPLMGPSWGQYGTHVDGAGQVESLFIP